MAGMSNLRFLHQTSEPALGPFSAPASSSPRARSFEQYPCGSLEGDHQFRLLDLLPGLADSVIRCELLPCDLNRPGFCRKFEALSYEWGKSVWHHCIEVNGQDFRTHANLHAFLMVLRSPTNARTFWADAICINQQDILERNQQVRIMYKIFSQAEQVLSWLGPAAASSDFLFDFCNALHNAPRPTVQRIE